MDPNQAPRVFSGRYELDHLIARGGMAEVYRARDRLLDRPVALKVLFPELSVDRSFVERFRREAQAAANLSHPNIVPVFDWGEDAGTYFIVMEFVDGRPLSSILKTAGPLSAERAADIGSHVAAALGFAHKHGVIHRDVKPGNVLITDEGQVKVTDFGIARAINTEESLTQTGAVMGTATYFSPEQAEGMGVDASSDIYSLGVVLFEMVTGRPPFLGDTPVAVASKHVRDHPPAPRELNPSIPPEFEAIILKSMAKNPDFRYATSEDLRADLLRFNEGRAVLAMSEATAVQGAVGATRAVGVVGDMHATQVVARQPGPTGPGPHPPRRGNRTRTYVIALVALLVALAVVLGLLGSKLGWWGGTTTFGLPSVVGQTVGQATSTLQGDGLTVVNRSQGSSSKAGTVLETDPKAGTKVKSGSTVTLTVATTAKVTIPSGLVGGTEAAAEAQLTQLGLKSTVTKVTNSAPSGQVTNTSPAAGRKVNANSTVTLTVSSGPAAVTVPNVNGDTYSQAAAAINAVNGLSVAGQTLEASSSVPSGSVIATSPAEGSSQPPGTAVTIFVSSGPANVNVASVVGQSQASATSTLQGQGLQVSTTTASSSVCNGPNSPGPGNVASQNPSAQTPVSSGSTVTIAVCSSSSTTTTTSSTSTTTTAP
jgi:serine/threonine-protein kinase